MLLRALSKVPWQASAAAGWGFLISAPVVAEVWERESPLDAAKHNQARPGSSVNDATMAQLKADGFVIGLILSRALGPPYP